MHRPAIAIAMLLAVVVAGCSSSQREQRWDANETKLIASLSLSQLPELPPDPSNRVAEDPAAAALGQQLFFDTRLSSNGKVSCASCHQPDRQFEDGLPLAKGVGTTTRRTMPIAGTAYSPWLFWDGRKDSLWSQALGPIESPVEHGTNRTQVAHLIASSYAAQYEDVFGSTPDLEGIPVDAAPTGEETWVAAWTSLSEVQRERVNVVFANVGKAIAAYERTIMPGPSRFDAYADALAAGKDTSNLLSEGELEGLKLFIGKGNCTNCHNGPLLTDNYFHNTGVPAATGLPEDVGRARGAEQVLADAFNCLGPYSDAAPDDCAELRYMTAEGEELVRAYKPPSLRGVAGRSPYMHAGQFQSMADVLAHYNTAPAAPAGHSELEALKMSKTELAALEAFLHTLSPIEGDK